MKKTSLLPFAVALALSGVLPEEAHAAQDPATLASRAEQGDVSAMLKLGQAHLDGRGVEMDVPRAIQLLESVIARNGPQAAFAHTALANHYERTMRTADDKARMFRHYRLAAGLGDTAAQTRLGSLLLQSIQSTGLDPKAAQALREQAVGLLEHAHANGRADAASELGSAYLYGRGVERNAATAIAWLTKAADAKHRVASYTLGYQYLNAPQGQGYDATKARHYLQQAADLRHPGAITALANAHLSGKHWATDIEAAKRLAEVGVTVQAAGAQGLLDRANAAVRAMEEERLAQQRKAEEAARARAEEEARLAAQADQEAQRLAKEKAAAVERERIAQIARETVEQEARRKEQLLAQQEARRTTPAPAKTVAVASQQLVSGVVGSAASVTAAAPPRAVVRTPQTLPGEFLPPVGGAAAERRIAELSAENTRLTEEVSYLRTELVERDERIATLNDNLDRATDRMNQIEQRLASLDTGGVQPAQRRVAAETKPEAWNRAGLDYFRAGEFDRAVREFDRAARSGNVEAMNNLGMAYLQGKGVPRDAQTAMAYFRDAAAKGHATAANNIGHIYENGLGVARDHTRAQLWYRRAAHLDTVVANATYASAEGAGYRIVAH